MAEPSRKGFKFNVDIPEIIYIIQKGSLCNRLQDPGFQTQLLLYNFGLSPVHEFANGLLIAALFVQVRFLSCIVPFLIVPLAYSSFHVDGPVMCIVCSHSSWYPTLDRSRLGSGSIL